MCLKKLTRNQRTKHNIVFSAQLLEALRFNKIKLHSLEYPTPPPKQVKIKFTSLPSDK